MFENTVSVSYKGLTMSNIKDFIKKEFVLFVSAILMIVSCFFVPISSKYVSYIDFRVLAILFCLMLTVAGFRSIGLFEKLSAKLFSITHTLRISALAFIVLVFFSSMIITNDVALILFVPFTIFTLKKHLNSRQFIFLIVFETIAANLGSMLTPIGNPQNLFIYTFYRMDIGVFFKTMFPYSLMSLILLILCCFFFPNTPIVSNTSTGIDAEDYESDNLLLKYTIYTFLFFLILSTVARFTPFGITLLACIIIVAITDYKLFLKVDYALLLTFMALFVFVGNMGEISTIKNSIKSVLIGRELLVSLGLSQLISNVPATLLLSKFTTNAKLLLIGVNLGGLGTMIASMASLISYKFYASEKGSKIFSYFLWFTMFNIAFLALLLITSFFF